MSSRLYEESGNNLDLALLTFVIALFIVCSVMYTVYEGVN